MSPDMYAWDSEEVPHMQNSKNSVIYNDEAQTPLQVCQDEPTLFISVVFLK